MKISRDVITDLLPVYFSGEASDDTKALVQRFFEQDPEFARLARTDVDELLEDLEPNREMEDVEMTAFKKTKRLLRIRSTLLGFAIFFTVAPWSFYVTDETGFQWVVLDNPTAVAVYLGVAAVLWPCYIVLGRRTRTSEL